MQVFCSGPCSQTPSFYVPLQQIFVVVILTKLSFVTFLCIDIASECCESNGWICTRIVYKTNYSGWKGSVARHPGWQPVPCDHTTRPAMLQARQHECQRSSGSLEAPPGGGDGLFKATASFWSLCRRHPVLPEQEIQGPQDPAVFLQLLLAGKTCFASQYVVLKRPFVLRSKTLIWNKVYYLPEIKLLLLLWKLNHEDEDGGDVLPRNFGIHLLNRTASQPRGPSPWEPRISDTST